MLSQVFTVLALSAATLVAGAPTEAKRAEELAILSNAHFTREDSNGNDNWDTLLGVSFDLATDNGPIHCNVSSPRVPSIKVPSIKYVCSVDPLYTFEITDRPGYDQYAFTVYHTKDVSYSGDTIVGCNGPIPSSCSQVGSNPVILTPITGA